VALDQVAVRIGWLRDRKRACLRSSPAREPTVSDLCDADDDLAPSARVAR
jgi:hypothetical protein